MLYKDDVSEESAASTFIVEVKPQGRNSSDIVTMRPGPTGKASFSCVYLNTTPRVGCGDTGVKIHHPKSRHCMEVRRQLHSPTGFQNKCLRSCMDKRPAGSQNLSGSSGRQKILCHYRESNLDSWVFEPVLMSYYAIRALRESYWTKNQILQSL